jgi:dephospho-CoA kinase
MKVIGLTGGIGSGKSTVTRFLAELGAAVIDLDKVGHDVLKKGSAPYKQVVSAFGKDILSADGEIDRARLAKIVFNNSQALQCLNDITHPAIDKAVDRIIREQRRKSAKAVVFEAAALLEAERAFQVDEIWVTVAPVSTVLQRLKERSGYSKLEAEARIRAQMTNDEKIKRADVVIDTDCSLDELKARVTAEWQKLLQRS